MVRNSIHALVLMVEVQNSIHPLVLMVVVRNSIHLLVLVGNILQQVEKNIVLLSSLLFLMNMNYVISICKAKFFKIARKTRMQAVWRKEAECRLLFFEVSTNKIENMKFEKKTKTKQHSKQNKKWKQHQHVTYKIKINK